MSKYAKEVNKCLAKIKRGEDSQYQKLFDLTWNHLSVVAKYYLKNKSYCEDVVMESYERVMKYINSYDEQLDGYNWLCKITEMVAYAFNQKDKAFEDSKKIEGGNIVEDFADEIDLATDLDSVIKGLDAESRTIVVCYYYLNMTYEEIGKKVGKTKSAICKRLKRILKEMKNDL